MITLDDISMAVIALIRLGAVFRFVYCMVQLQGAEEEQARYKKRAKNTVVFYVDCRVHLADRGDYFLLLWCVRRRST